MKTKEFIERLSALGYSTSKYRDTIEVLKMLTPSYGRIYGRIHRKEPYRIETTQYTHQDPRLFDLMVEYARTPLDEREEPTKYYLKPKGLLLVGDHAMMYSREQNKWAMGKSESEYQYFQIQFTLEELKELGIPIEHYDLEEVKE